MYSLSRKYYWSGINTAQQRICGESRATSASLLEASLRQRGIQAIKISCHRNLWKFAFNTKISEQQITDFYQQLLALLNAGIPLITALKVSVQSNAKTSMRNLLAAIEKSLENGKSLSEAIAYYPEYFDVLCRHLFFIGEQIGNINVLLEKIIEYRKNLSLIKSKIQKALFYPIIVACIAFIIIMILLLVVIPELQNLFTDFGKELPGYTSFLLRISGLLRKAGWLAPFFLFFICGFLYYCSSKIKINIPFISSIIKNYFHARWTHSLAILLQAGIPLAQALYIVAKTLIGQDYSFVFQKIRDKIIQGQSLYNAIETSLLFPSQIKQMIYVGEQAGNLPSMLLHVSLFYQTKANTQVENLLALLEPLLIIFLGVIIGGIVVAMYLPVLQVGKII